MKILLWHGYLLTGSGSNVFTSNLARSWRRKGHDVLLMCQERAPQSVGFVDEAGDFIAGNTAFRLDPSPGAIAASGRCRLARPDIGSLLPVYVYDRYDGFTVKLFVDLSDEELADYTDRNVRAMVTAINAFEPDAIITGHEIMGPEIARRACEMSERSYIAKLHGSALEYAVKKQARYARYAATGLGAAAGVVGGSRYMVEEAAAHVPGWAQRAAVVNPGCDVEVFQPRPRSSNTGTVGFVGKLIASKGAHHLIAALPLCERVRRAVIVGYGGFEDGLRCLAQAVGSGDIPQMLAVARGGETHPLVDLVRFLETAPADYVAAARSTQIEFTGRLDHHELSRALPTFDTLAVPSVVSEAFGMVAAEAAAAGVLPIVPAHSGIGEAGAAIEQAIGRPGLLTFDPADPIPALAAAIDRVLEIPLEQRVGLEQVAVRLAHERWSWDHVADSLLELATAG